MTQKQRIAALILNTWTALERLQALGGIKSLPPKEGPKGHLVWLGKSISKEQKDLDEAEAHWRKGCQMLLFKAGKDGKADQGLFPKTVAANGIGDIVVGNSVSATAIQFRLGLTSTKLLNDICAALGTEGQDQEILDCIEITKLSLTLTKNEVAINYPLDYFKHDWCGNIDAVLAEIESIGNRVKKFASIAKWLQANLTPEQNKLIELRHIYVKLVDVKWDATGLVSAKIATSDTPAGIKQRELRAKILEALNVRTKKVLALNVGPNLTFTLEGEAEPLTFELDLITNW